MFPDFSSTAGPIADSNPSNIPTLDKPAPTVPDTTTPGITINTSSPTNIPVCSTDSEVSFSDPVTSPSDSTSSLESTDSAPLWSGTTNLIPSTISPTTATASTGALTTRTANDMAPSRDAIPTGPFPTNQAGDVPPTAGADSTSSDVPPDTLTDGPPPERPPDVLSPDGPPDVPPPDGPPDDVPSRDVSLDVPLPDGQPSDGPPDVPLPDVPSSDVPRPDVPSLDVPPDTLIDDTLPDASPPDVPPFDGDLPDVPSPNGIASEGPPPNEPPPEVPPDVSPPDALGPAPDARVESLIPPSEAEVDYVAPDTSTTTLDQSDPAGDLAPVDFTFPFPDDTDLALLGPGFGPVPVGDPGNFPDNSRASVDATASNPVDSDLDYVPVRTESPSPDNGRPGPSLNSRPDTLTAVDEPEGKSFGEDPAVGGPVEGVESDKNKDFKSKKTEEQTEEKVAEAKDKMKEERIKKEIEKDEKDYEKKECGCDAQGSVSPHCSDSGLCQCKDGVSGRSCDSCLPGYTWRGGGAGCIKNVCDEQQVCQNGGTCIDFKRCICLDSFTGNSTPDDVKGQVVWAGPEGVCVCVCVCVCVGTFCENGVCLKKSGCLDNAVDPSSHLTSHLYLLTLSLLTFTCG
ncbi:hypothetical protein PAMA_017780 [Pampus argenteus]